MLVVEQTFFSEGEGRGGESITDSFNPFGDGRRVAKKPHFSPIPLVWTSFRLISIRMAKNEFFRKKT